MVKQLYILLFVFIALNANAQIQPWQIHGKLPKTVHWIMGTDTVSTSFRYGQGEWFMPTDTAWAVGTDTIIFVSLDGDTTIFDTGDMPDADWYETGGTTVPDMDSDSMYHTGLTAIGDDGPYIGNLTVIHDPAQEVGIDIESGGDSYFLQTRTPGDPDYAWIFGATDTYGFAIYSRYAGATTYPLQIEGAAPSNTLQLQTDGDVQVSDYPNSRDDGSPTNVLGTDASGVIQSYPVADVTGAGSSDHDWYEQGTTTPPNNIDDNMFTGTGNHGIGTTTPAKPLHVVGVMRLTGSGGTATTITGRDTNHDITDVGVGWGADLTSGNLVIDSSQVATQYDLTLATGGAMTHWLWEASGTGGTYSVTDGATAKITAGTGISATRSSNVITITNTGVITEVDGSITNEGILGVGAGGGSSSTLLSNTSTSNPVTINVAGINTISESTSSNGGSITITGTEVDGSVTNETNTIEENNASVQTGNLNIDYQTCFDVATDGGTEVNVSLDLGEATTVTTPESDDYLIMHDAGSAQNQKILYSDVASLIGDGNFAENNLTFTADRIHDMANFNLTLSNVDQINFDAGTFYVDGPNNRVGVGTTSPDNTFNVEATAQIETKIRDLADVADLYLDGTINSAASTASFRFNNKDTDIDHTGDYYQVANLTPTKRSATVPGGYLNFNIGYDTLLLNNVLRLGSKESGATEGYAKFFGGQRDAWIDESSATHTLNTGEYGVVMSNSSAKTITLPTIGTTGAEPNRGQHYVIYNDASSGNITFTPGGGQTFAGTNAIPPGQVGLLYASNAGKWTLIRNGNINGTYSIVNVVPTTTYTVTIGTTMANTSYTESVTPRNAVTAASLFYITNKTTTTFDVVFTTALAASTVLFDWTVFSNP